jgi:hypothetical protein
MRQETLSKQRDSRQEIRTHWRRRGVMRVRVRTCARGTARVHQQWVLGLVRSMPLDKIIDIKRRHTLHNTTTHTRCQERQRAAQLQLTYVCSLHPVCGAVRSQSG